MKIKIKEFCREHTFVAHLVLDAISQSQEALDTITSRECRSEEDEVEVLMTVNGVEVDIRKFTNHLEESWDDEVNRACKPEATKMFEAMKHDFKSKNSTNAQLNKINVQIEKARNMLKNIEESIRLIK